MAQVEVRSEQGARTGAQFLEGLGQGGREIWLRGEKITHPLDHPELREAALSMARVFDLQHEHAEEMLAPSPAEDGSMVNVTHLIPRSREDLQRRALILGRREGPLVASDKQPAAALADITRQCRRLRTVEDRELGGRPPEGDTGGGHGHEKS